MRAARASWCTEIACSSSARAAASSSSRALLDQAQAEVDVAEQPSLLGLLGTSGRAELRDAPTSWRRAAASSRSAAQPRVKLRRLAADRCHADRVLEQPARVGVMAVGDAGRRPQRPAHVRRRDEPSDHGRRSGMRDLPARNSRKPSSSSPSRRNGRRELRRIGLGRRSSVARRPEAGRGTSPRGRARGPRRPQRSAVEQLDVVPDARIDAAARVDELEREVWRPFACAAAASARPRRRPRRPGPRRAPRSRSRTGA